MEVNYPRWAVCLFGVVTRPNLENVHIWQPLLRFHAMNLGHVSLYVSLELLLAPCLSVPCSDYVIMFNV